MHRQTPQYRCGRMTYVWHQCLEPHVLDTSNILRSLKVFARPILSSFPGIVNEVFGHLAQGPAFFAEVDNNTATPFLGFLHSFLHSKDEVRSACAYIGSKDIATVTFIVNTESEANSGIGHLCGIAEDVYCQATDGWKEKFDIVPGDQLRVRSSGLFKQGSPECSLI